MNHRKRFLSNVLKLSFSIFLNKPIGLIRDILRIKYFGVTALGDAFSVAWRIPNTLRRIFGEGNLSSALIPTLIEAKEHKGGDRLVSQIVTLLLMVMGAGILLFCFCIMGLAPSLIHILSPGSLSRVALAGSLLRILIFFTYFISTAVILGCALQTHHIYYSGPLGQLVLNIFLCIQFYCCLHWHFSVQVIAWCVLFNGFSILAIHYILFRREGFSLQLPTREAWGYAKHFFKKLLPTLISGGITDINLFIDQATASYLPIGSQSLLDYVSGFIRIPLQVIGSSLGTVCSSEFTYIILKKKRRLSFYFFEIAQLILFLSIPVVLLFYFFSYDLLRLIFLSERFTMEHVASGTRLLLIFSFIVFFSSINKVIVNIFYAYHIVNMLTKLSFGAAAMNAIGNIIFMRWYGIAGIALSTVCVEIARTLLFLFVLKKNRFITFPIKRFLKFFATALVLYGILLVLGVGLFFLLKELLCYFSLFDWWYHSIFYLVLKGLVVFSLLPIGMLLKRRFRLSLYYLKKW